MGSDNRDTLCSRSEHGEDRNRRSGGRPRLRLAEISVAVGRSPLKSKTSSNEPPLPLPLEKRPNRGQRKLKRRSRLASSARPGSGA